MRTVAFLSGAILAAIGLVVMSGPSTAQQSAKATYQVYIGTQTTGSASKGIYRSEFVPASGKLTPAVLVAETPSPTYVALHPNKKYLYAINAVTSFQGQQSGSVSAYEI